MFDHQNRRNFYSAPQSVTSLVAAFTEPALAIAAYLLALHVADEAVGRPDLTLCLLVFALTFPGRNRFFDTALSVAVDVIGAWMSLLVILALCAYATRSFHLFDREVLMTWAVATPLAHIAAVWAGQRVLRWNAAQPGQRRAAVVIGAGELGVKVAQALRENHVRGIDFVGWFDDRATDRVHADAAALRLGGLREAAPYILSQGIKDVFITLPLGSQPRIIELLENLQGTTASVYFVPDVFGISIIQGRLQDMNGVPVVGICDTPFKGTNELVKRVSDIVLSTLILILVSPVLLALAIGVKLSSPGPVIFRQRRNGLDGEEIVVYKFRSMVTQDNGHSVPQAVKGDARLTPFGAFIRRTSLDELPQFINVLQGRMSIVGPRPHAVAHNEQYRQLIKAYMVRHKVRPGITGWAQVNGLRGETESLDKMRARVAYDLEYLRNWSLGFDLQIIARTVKLVFFDRNAY
ncbi:undecaprenyl-phosphate glucose phosphotransferase [Ideonella sp. A 288]|uniref:undecaprenyl-phosphate glucose phosphotransferase n=1 Tax=Ideonella sp. A 288 TaxID=1962181 RepID=UPI000B4B4171|nr:undecaprenyl-phosphate glucose phosphotransferase [Ideonella sp. A 288]